MTIETLPPLRETIDKHKLSARKGLGQHFLLDLNLTRRISRTGGDLHGIHVVEIGAGPGGLTRALLLEGAARVTAIERDSRAIAALEELAAVASGRLTVIEGDAMVFDPSSLARDLPLRLIANLPYNVATPLLIRALYQIDAYQSLTLMFQREVAQRITAKVGDKDYGRLAVLVQSVALARLEFELSPRAFVPPPAVVSAIVQLTPLAASLRELLPPLAAIEQMTRAAFGQRRKMLRSSLRDLPQISNGEQLAALLKASDIDGTRRAETLSITEFHRLTHNWLSHCDND